MKKLIAILTVMIALGSSPASAAGESSKGIQFPDIPDIPHAGLSYDGFFKKHQPVKIVFGVSDPGGQMKESLTNAAYTIKYLKEKGYRYKIQVVLYGKAVLPADPFNQEYSGYGPLMEALHSQGVEFRVCNNSLQPQNLHADELYPYMKVIPAGILQIVKMQMQGYAYISNR